MKIPFDYEKYLTGKYDVQTESGVEVTELTKFTTTDYKCLYGTVQTVVLRWTLQGLYQKTDDMNSPEDLALVPKFQKIYKNVYENEAGQYYLGNQNFNSEQEAHISLRKVSNARYIQTIEIIDEL